MGGWHACRLASDQEQWEPNCQWYSTGACPPQALGEEAVLDEFPNGIIIRPADIFGDRDNFTTLMVNLLKGSNWPIMSNQASVEDGPTMTRTS